MGPKGIALLDWDNSLRGGFTLYDWAFYLEERELFSSSQAAELRDLLRKYSSNQISYEQLGTDGPRCYARGIDGVSTKVVADLAHQFVRGDRSVFSFAQPCVALLSELNLDVIVVSGAPMEILEMYRPQFRWTGIYGIEVARAGGRFTTKLSQNPATAKQKNKLVRMLSSDRNVAVAIGDSASDIPLFTSASLKIVVDNPKLLPPGVDVLNISSDWDSDTVLQAVRRSLKDRIADA